MAAVMSEIIKDELALEGLGHDLLEAWAPWARDDRGEGSHSWSVKPRIDRGYHGNPPDDFWVVDKIVAPQRRDKTNAWAVVSRFYLGEQDEGMIARDLVWSAARVRMNLLAFCGLVEREYRDWHEEIARQKKVKRLVWSGRGASYRARDKSLNP